MISESTNNLQVVHTNFNADIQGSTASSETLNHEQLALISYTLWSMNNSGGESFLVWRHGKPCSSSIEHLSLQHQDFISSLLTIEKKFAAGNIRVNQVIKTVESRPKDSSNPEQRLIIEIGGVTPLSECFRKNFHFILRANGLDNQQFQRLSRPRIEPETDSVISKIQQNFPHQDVIDLVMEYKTKGIDNFTCPELSTVLINMNKMMSQNHQTLGEYNNLQTLCVQFLQQIDTLHQSAAISYRETMCLCMKFSMLQTFFDLIQLPDSYFEQLETKARPSIDTIQQWCEKIIGTESASLIDTITAFSPIIHRYIRLRTSHANFINFASKISEWWSQGCPYLVWPTFSELDPNFFNRANVYPFFVAGLSNKVMDFHDGLTTLNWSLFCHDFFHASEIAKKNMIPTSHSRNVQNCFVALSGTEFFYSVDTTTSQKVAFLQAVEHLLSLTQPQLTQPELVTEAIQLVLFGINHEFGYTGFLGGTTKKDKVYPVSSSELIADVLFRNFCRYDVSPELKLHHLHFAVFLLSFVTLCQVYPDRFPQLYYPETQCAVQTSSFPCREVIKP